MKKPHEATPDPLPKKKGEPAPLVFYDKVTFYIPAKNSSFLDLTPEMVSSLIFLHNLHSTGLFS